MSLISIVSIFMAGAAVSSFLWQKASLRTSEWEGSCSLTNWEELEKMRERRKKELDAIEKSLPPCRECDGRMFVFIDVRHWENYCYCPNVNCTEYHRSLPVLECGYQKEGDQ